MFSEPTTQIVVSIQIVIRQIQHEAEHLLDVNTLHGESLPCGE